MAILTWQNVPAPDLSGSQQGIRTAGEMLQRAIEGGKGITDQLTAMDAAKKAADQQTIDKLAMQQILAAQDPAQAQQLMQNGFGPATGRVSIDTLLKADARPETLINRQEAAYKLAQAHANDRADAEFGTELAKTNILSDALYNTEKAEKDTLALFGRMKNQYTGDEAIKKAQQIRNFLVQTREQRALAGYAVKNLADEELANKIASRLNQQGLSEASKLAIRTQYENTNAKAWHRAVEIVSGQGGDSAAFAGEAPTAGEKSDLATQLPELNTELIIRDKKRMEADYGVTPSARIVINSAEKRTQSQPEAARELATRLGVPFESTNYLVQQLMSRAANAGLPLSAAEAAGLVELDVKPEYLLNVHNLKDGMDITWGNLKSRVEEINNSRTEADELIQFDKAHALTKQYANELASLKAKLKGQEAMVAGGNKNASKGVDRVSKQISVLEGKLKDHLDLAPKGPVSPAAKVAKQAKDAAANKLTAAEQQRRLGKILSGETDTPDPNRANFGTFQP